MLVYCDRIAHEMKQAIIKNIGWDVSHIKLDLDEDGAFASTKKTMTVTDANGQEYTVTVEEKRNS